MRGFISYAHDDVALLRRFRVHLKALEYAFGLTFWSDDSIQAGDHWNDTIREAIEQADVFLLLVSPAWIASDFIRNHERPAITDRCATTKCRVISVILKNCDWEPELGISQATPTEDGRLKPVSRWPDPDEGFDSARVAIHAAVRDHFGVKDRRYPDTDPVVAAPADPSGPTVSERNDKLDIQTSGTVEDIAATLDPTTRQLHEPNRQKARELIEMLNRIGNHLDPSWSRFVQAARELVDRIDRPLEEIPAQIIAVWEVSVRFASFLIQDKDLRAAQSRDPAPLPDEVHHAFDNLVVSLAPWVRHFPAARRLDDESGAFLARPELFAPSIRAARRAIQDDLLTPESERLMGAAIETAEGNDPAQGGKAGRFLTQTARALITRATSYAAGFRSGVVGTNPPLLRRVGAFLSGLDKTDAVELTADMPRDIQHGIERMLDLSHQPNFPGRVAPDGAALEAVESPRRQDAFVPPDDFLEQAKAMILRGEAPPAEWCPFITALDFVPEGRFSGRPELCDLVPLMALTELKSLYLDGTQVRDVTPLAALTALQTLHLRGTHVSDVTPLGALSALQSLDLMDTQVSDVTPLGVLSALQSLNLRGTQVSDVTPLRTLTALLSLDLRGTWVSDVTPLGTLTALQSLNLWSTRVSDVTPLGALTALRSLDLRHTEVNDVTPLGALTALQSLNLWSTQVSDVTPLRALTALRSLDLRHTEVSDVTPLGALTALQSLNLWSTQVGDVTPLGTLIALQSLDLKHTRVRDVTPLGALRNLLQLDLTGIQPSGVDRIRQPGLKIIRY